LYDTVSTPTATANALFLILDGAWVADRQPAIENLYLGATANHDIRTFQDRDGLGHARAHGPTPSTILRRAVLRRFQRQATTNDINGAERHAGRELHHDERLIAQNTS
jgi:hypothetical protein